MDGGKMQVGIVGAGIAGLGACIALRRAGHDVEVFEKSMFKNEIGAAIMLTPNGNRVLRKWSFGFEGAKGVVGRIYRMFTADDLKIINTVNIPDTEATYGDRMCAYHRVDLHSGLRELAESQNEEWGNLIGMRLGSEVVGVDAEAGVLTITGGELVKKDLIVLADGCHCTFVSSISGKDIPIHRHGKSVYRWLAPFSAVKEHPEAAKLWENQPAGFASFADKKGTFMVTYPCRDQELLNCAVFHDTRPGEEDKMDWNSSASHEDVLRVMKGWSAGLRQIPLTAKEIKVYAVTERPPAPKIFRGKVLAIGDTVHHMLPSHAQGACSALEDAGSLEVLFALPGSAASLPSTQSFSHTKENLQQRLELYQLLRMPRNATTQILSSTNPRMDSSNLSIKQAEIRTFYQGPLVNWPYVSPWGKQIRAFWWGYDVFEETRRALSGEDIRWFGDLDGFEEGNDDPLSL